MALSKSASTSDRTRFARLALVIVEELTPILRDIIESEISSNLIFNQVKSNKTLLKKLRNDQLLVIQNAQNDGYSDFDISLLYTLLRNICPNISSPTKGWGSNEMPSQGDISLGDEIERIRLIKNKLYSHVSTTSISQTEFNIYWADIYSLCQRMEKHLPKKYVQSLTNARFRPLDEELEMEWMEKIKDSSKCEQELLAIITEMAASVRRLENGLLSATAKVDVRLNHPAKKEVASVFLETTCDFLNLMIDCIDKHTTEKELKKIYSTIEEISKAESSEIPDALFKSFFKKLSSKVKSYANQRVNKFDILFSFTRFTIRLKRKYGADIKSYNGCLLLKLIFFAEKSHILYITDLESGEIGKQIIDLLLYPSYLACFDLKPKDLVILLNNQIIFHDTEIHPNRQMNEEKFLYLLDDEDIDDAGRCNLEAKTEESCLQRPCDLCLGIGESVNAMLVCKQEQIYLCNPCGKRHQIQRSTKSHVVIEIKEYEENKLFCEICESQNEKVPAYGFCETCKDPEYMCQPCSRRHTAYKMFKNHSICTNLDEMNLMETKYAEDTMSDIDRDTKIFKCSLCTNLGENRIASCFCTSCETPEPLCDVCGRHHIRQRNMRDHSLSHDMEAYNSFLESNTINCELCLIDGDRRSASSFCLTCEEPEALCGACASQHIKQRTFRNHQISNDIRGLLKKEKLLCEPCTIEGERTPADSFCKDCDEPEPLCNDCARQHVKQRQFRDHTICDDISQIPLKVNEKSSVLCIVCKEEGTNTEATCFCKDCNDKEPLCPDCARQHTRQSFRGHNLCTDLSLLRKLGKEMVVCYTCKLDRKDVPADAYCRDCSDPQPLCNSCAGHHVKQKLFRNHNIDRNISSFINFINPDDAECDICKIDGKRSKTSKYCNNCDEHLCKECVETHLKFSPKHEITDNVSNRFLCEPCERRNRNVSADSFCENCEEPMCTTCSEQHVKQKPSRDHVISSNMLKYFKPKWEKRNIEEKPAETLHTTDTPMKSKEEDMIETKKRIRGKPNVLNIKSDLVELYWETLEEEIDYYQIRFKSLKGNDKWKFCNTNDKTNRFSVSGLMADTPYVFQVRSVANDIEGNYSELSEPIQTTKSLTTKMLNFSTKIPNTDPMKYQLAADENREARNSYAKTRQLTLGNPAIGTEFEKTMMLVGETGSGKSTLVDGIINYILGVSFEDPFRFTLVNLEQDEKKTENQAESQTEWITVYKIAPQEGSRLDYTLNVIDTPGFGDIRGIQRDGAILDQIRHLFSTEGKQGVAFIDAVCFIVKAPNARLTVAQKYFFNSILSLFGKDIESNICTLITFADGAEPLVLSCLKAANLPFGFCFPFNNSALFASNRNLQNTSLSPLFWDMCCKSFQNFFEKMKSFKTKSLMQTKDMLKQREHLKLVLTNIQPQVNADLMKLNELQNTLTLFKKHQNDIESNKDFTYEAEITKQVKLELPVGQHVTNCLICNISCHENCEFADEDQKCRCSAMDSEGNCKVCTGKCHWKQHKNGKYIFKYVTEKKVETYQEKKKLYEKAKGEKMTHEKYLEEIETDIYCLFDTISSMMDEMAMCKNRLKDIALRPDPLSTVEHIDQMIQAEEINKQVGYEKRIKMLYEIKQFAQIDECRKPWAEYAES